MITKKEFQSILDKYPLNSVGHIRDKYLKKLVPVLSRKEILILKGILRWGRKL
jgi:hypothetical protein